MKTRTKKRSEAIARQAEYDALTTTEKIDRAVQRGHSGTRESRRLMKQRSAESARNE